MPTITWLGHACWLIQTGEHSILLDPFLDSSPTAPCKAKDIRADYVLVSHGHFDHCAEAAEVANANSATLIANYEIATWFATKHGVQNTIGMNLGGSTPTSFGRVKMTVAWHSSVLPDGTYGGSPAGFVLELEEGARIYFACDTALFSDMRLIGNDGRTTGDNDGRTTGDNDGRTTGGEPKLDLAVLPIGDLFTMGIEDSLAAIQLLQPRVVAPSHYNTWPPIAQDATAWAARVSSETKAQPRVLQPGESFSL